MLNNPPAYAREKAGKFPIGSRHIMSMKKKVGDVALPGEYMPSSFEDFQ
jgi:hypothetical protein